MDYNCTACGVPLIVGETITQNRLDHSSYVCRTCRAKSMREWLHRTGRTKPMSENRKCSAFLGVFVAERVLSHVFQHVERMPYGTPGYDFTCGRDYMVDVKSSCRRHHKPFADDWIFVIKKNKIAEYFLCLAFDNRESLNPEHIWLIPAEKVNDHVTVTISETRLAKWDAYTLDVEKVSTCCDILRHDS